MHNTQRESMKKILDSIAPQDKSAAYEGNTALIARQPIFDRKSTVNGYELLFRDPNRVDKSRIKNSHAATSSVMIDGFNLMRPTLGPKQKFYINFTDELLSAGVASILPPDICVLEILEDSSPSKELLTSLQKLKNAGYTLALDDFTGQKELEPFLPFVDIVKIDVLHTDEEKLPGIAYALRDKLTLLAEKVEDPEMVHKCMKLGFSLFQGFFFSKGELVSGKTISPTQITKTRLLAFAADEETSIHDISEAISADVSLTVKLLHYVNSVYFGLPVKIKDINHAIMLLGKTKLRHWLYVTALADLDSAPLSREIAYISALRAKFLENIGIKVEATWSKFRNLPSSLFLLGLFSLLDKILQVPFHELRKVIPIDESILEALSNGKGPLALWLHLLTSYEEGNWAKTRKIAKVLKVTDSDLVRSYTEAALWSSTFFGPQS